VEREVLQARFAASEDAGFVVPELDDVWMYLGSGPTLDDYATVGNGLIFNGRTRPNARWTIRDATAVAGELGFANVDPHLQIYSLPTLKKLNLDPAGLQCLASRRPTGQPQVLLNYAPVARKPWKLKATLDKEGHALTSRFSAIRPKNGGPSALYLWAILNSPVANAFAYDMLGKRDILVGTMRKMPLPPHSPTHEAAIEQAATRYRQLAVRVVPAEDSTPGLFNSGTPHAASAPTNAEVKDALLAMDAAVLRAYALPVRLERRLLDVFQRGRAQGRRLHTFGDYFPANFKSLVPLHKFISAGYRASTVDQVAARMKPDGTSAGTAALRAAAEAFGGDD